MAQYRRPYRKTSKRRSSTSWYNKKYSALDIAQKALRNTRYLKGLVNSEMLHKDTAVTLGAQQANINVISNPSQDDTASGRTGNSILLRNIYFRGTIAINTSVTANTRITLALVKDTQQVSDTQPGVGDIFDSVTDPDTLLKLGNSGRFKIIWRKTYTLTPVSGGRNVVDITKYWKVYDHVRFNGPNNTDTQKNGYYIAMISSESTNFPSCTLNTRIGYHDN